MSTPDASEKDISELFDSRSSPAEGQPLQQARKDSAVEGRPQKSRSLAEGELMQSQAGAGQAGHAAGGRSQGGQPNVDVGPMLESWESEQQAVSAAVASRSPPAKRTKAKPSRLSRFGLWADRLLSRLSDRVDPILVKEARQAIKSRQFTITFGLLLGLAWIYTFAAVAYIGPEIVYSASGRQVLFGYYVGLAFCTLVVVPFGAYRSLATEREDGTYELVAVTTLSPQQIIGGKLCSALMQTLLYFSALAPCLAFTYLLQGIDLATIALILIYMAFASAGLAMVGLLAGTLTTDKHWGVLISVAVLGGLGLIFLLSLGAGSFILFQAPEISLAEPLFWVLNFFLFSGYASTYVLLFLIAVAGITFASANRSTALRWAMVAQHVLWTGWMGWFFFGFFRQSTGWLDVVWLGWLQNALSLAWVGVYFLGSAQYWIIMGIFLTNESSNLSPRIQRTLPRSLLGRMFLTFFNPGPGTGLLFAVGNMLVAAVLSIGAIRFSVDLERGGMQGVQSSFLTVILFTLGYTWIYMGLGYWITQHARRFSATRNIPAILVHMLLILGGSLGSLLVHFSWELGTRVQDYSIWLWPNPFETVDAVLNAQLLPSNWQMNVAVGGAPYAVGFAAVVVLFLVLPELAGEINRTRAATPHRVEEEEAALHPRKEAPYIPTSPWDTSPTG